MPGFPLGMITLVIIAALIYFGLAHRVIDRLYLSDSAALALVAAMAVGSFIDLPLLRGPVAVSLNVGGGLIPVGLAGYVLARAGTRTELYRALLGIGVTAAAVFLVNGIVGRGDPWERGADLLDPLYVYPLIAGGVAALVGRSRRTAFISAVLGVLALDVVDLFRLSFLRMRGAVSVGGAGIFDVALLSGVAAVLLTEAVGELRERLQGGVAETGRPASLLQALQRPRLALAARKEKGGGER